ncbi:MAG: TPM domain-containing protein [Polyangiaceae bacterium]
MRAVWLASIACFVFFFAAPGAEAAFKVPPIEGHLTDAAGLLSPEQQSEIEQRLSLAMDQSGVEVAVFIVDSLQGETIEDVAYQTFNTWKIGRDKLDNGVLLVIAPKERRIRIETGKGIGGEMTDLQASDIIEHRIAPRLREGMVQAAIDSGIEGIVATLGAPRAQPSGALGIGGARISPSPFGFGGFFRAPFFVVVWGGWWLGGWGERMGRRRMGRRRRGSRRRRRLLGRRGSIGWRRGQRKLVNPSGEHVRMSMGRPIRCRSNVHTERARPKPQSCKGRPALR